MLSGATLVSNHIFAGVLKLTIPCVLPFLTNSLYGVVVLWGGEGNVSLYCCIITWWPFWNKVSRETLGIKRICLPIQCLPYDFLGLTKGHLWSSEEKSIWLVLACLPGGFSCVAQELCWSINSYCMVSCTLICAIIVLHQGNTPSSVGVFPCWCHLKYVVSSV